MRKIVTSLIIVLCAQAFAQMNKPWTKIEYDRTAASDIIEVNDGYIVGVLVDFFSNVISPQTNAYLLKLDYDLNIIDTVGFPLSMSFFDSPPTFHKTDDSIYVYYQRTLPPPYRYTYKSIFTYDHNLNKGSEYVLDVDSLILNFKITPYEDTAFVFAGSNNVNQDNSIYIIVFDFEGNILKTLNFNTNFYVGPALSIANIPNTDQIIISTNNQHLFYINMNTEALDSVVYKPNVIDNMQTFPNGSNYAINLVSLDLASVFTFDDFGVFNGPFLIDSTFVRESGARLQPPLLHGMDYDSISGHIYTINAHEYNFSPPGWRPGEDTSVGEIFVHKFDPFDHSLVWKKQIEVFRISGLSSYPPSPTSIRATSDGGCVAAFFSYSEDSTDLPDPPAAFILKLGPNGELMSQTSFEAPKPQISIYPNPAKESLFINSHQTAVEITINDVSGRVVYQSPSRQFQHQVDVQEWPSGMYVVQMTGKDGKRWTEKVLVE